MEKTTPKGRYHQIPLWDSWLIVFAVRRGGKPGKAGKLGARVGLPHWPFASC